MEHNLFKPQSFEDGQHGVVGNCNGIPMEVRYREETPVFASKILSFTSPRPSKILDYGCGVGRLSKEILAQDETVDVVGVDSSAEMRDLAVRDINSDRFEACHPESLNMPEEFDVAVLVYVLQHIPAIEIREALQRIHYSLKDSGKLIYCSSNYRMAVRFDQPGFYDDRHLGVDLIEELKRFFICEGPLFADAELEQNEVVKTMVTGGENGLPHPALVFRNKPITGPIFNAVSRHFVSNELKSAYDKGKNTLKKLQSQDNSEKKAPQKANKRLVLVQKQSPGDIMMATVALRDLHKAFPGEYATDVRTPCNAIFAHNPHVTPIQGSPNEDNIIEKLKADDKHPPIDDGDVTYCNLHYPMIHRSGDLGTHFSDSMTAFLAKQLGREIPRTGLRPELYLSQDEQLWPGPAAVKAGFDKPYWVINAGHKSDFPLKQYPYYQEVVNLLKDRVTFVQIGMTSHVHPQLDGVINMIGQTDNFRELARLIYKAEGVLTCVSLPMHVAAALEKPCVVVAGGREGTRWELYPDHRFLYTNGALDCCRYDGCWKSQLRECQHVTDAETPLCMEMITPQMVADAIEMYYRGGTLRREEKWCSHTIS